jgi:methylated-DNA-[protein]-cysteine S-methyltransferase
MGIDAKKVYFLTKKIPKGRVTIYGEIARVLGSKKKYSRAVGRILNKNMNPEVPCHRVVYSNGNVGGFRGGVKKKIEILKGERIKINKEGKILNFQEVLFRF